MNKSKVEILECTLRDGSYSIDFQFNAQETAIISAALENAGIKLIEIGHGTGLNSSNSGKGVAAATDEEYLQAAAETIRHAKWGMFFIPGIGRHQDLDLAAEYGMDFVRIGTNVTEISTAEEYIRHAKDLGLFVSSNLMKTYALPPDTVAQYGTQIEKYGADIICIVDSAGTMLPEDIRRYFNEIQKKVELPLGLHCHDNLALGMANVLTAIDCGAEIVDSTLQGLGRGGGNPVTEILVTVLKKKGIDLGINEKRLMDISQQLIKPLKKDSGWDPINISAGYAGFHSSYLPIIKKYSKQYSVDPRELILGLCEIDQVNASEELVERIAKRLSYEESRNSNIDIISLPKIVYSKSHSSRKEASLTEVARIIARECKSRSIKKGKICVFNLVTPPKLTDQVTVSRFIQEEFEYIICSAEVYQRNHYQEIIDGSDGIIDVFLVDNTQRQYVDSSMIPDIRKMIKQSKFFEYNDSDIWVRSIFYQIDFFNMIKNYDVITIIGDTIEAIKLARVLSERDFKVVFITGEERKKLHKLYTSSIQRSKLAVFFHLDKPIVSIDILKLISQDAIIIDGSIGSIEPDAMRWAHDHNIKIIRPDMRAALAGEIAGLLGTYKINSQLMGKTKIAGITVLGGGVIGKKGDLIVDSLINPTRVIGVADGFGKLIDNVEEYEDTIRVVESELFRQRAIF